MPEQVTGPAYSTLTQLTAKYGSVRRLAVAYARGRLTAEEECVVETLHPQALGVFAALALVDDRRDPATTWKP